MAAAIAVWLIVPPAAERRLGKPRFVRLPAWLAPLPDALGTRQRGLVGAVLAAAVAAWSGQLGWWGVLPAVAAGGLAFILLGRFTTADRARRGDQMVAALPQACDLLAVAVEAGLPVRLAVEAVAPTVEGPLGDALAGVAARVRLGIPEPQAWAELESEPGLEALSRELARTVTSGIGIARLLRELALEARRTAAAAAVVRARRVGVRSVVPLMLAFLPSFVLLGIVPLIGGIVQTALP